MSTVYKAKEVAMIRNTIEKQRYRPYPRPAHVLHIGETP